MSPRKKKAPPVPMPTPGTAAFADWIQSHADTLITTLQDIMGPENWQKYMCAMFGTVIDATPEHDRMLRVRLRGHNNMMLETMAHLITCMAKEVEAKGFDQKDVAIDKMLAQLLHYIRCSNPEFQVATEG